MRLLIIILADKQIHVFNMSKLSITHLKTGYWYIIGWKYFSIVEYVIFSELFSNAACQLKISFIKYIGLALCLKKIHPEWMHSMCHCYIPQLPNWHICIISLSIWQRWHLIYSSESVPKPAMLINAYSLSAISNVILCSLHGSHK